MTVRTFNELFEPDTIRLSLLQTEPSGYVILDQHGGHYVFCAMPLDACLRHMMALAKRYGFLIDDASIERATWHSVRVGALTERDSRTDGETSRRIGVPGRDYSLGEANAREPLGANRSSRSVSAGSLVSGGDCEPPAETSTSRISGSHTSETDTGNIIQFRKRTA